MLWYCITKLMLYSGLKHIRKESKTCVQLSPGVAAACPFQTCDEASRASGPSDINCLIPKQQVQGVGLKVAQYIYSQR